MIERFIPPSRPQQSQIACASAAAFMVFYYMIRQFPTALIYRQPPSGQSQVYRARQLRTNGVHCRESAGTGRVALKVVPVTGAAFSDITMDQLMYASVLAHSLLVCSGYINSHSYSMCDIYRNKVSGYYAVHYAVLTVYCCSAYTVFERSTYFMYSHRI